MSNEPQEQGFKNKDGFGKIEKDIIGQHKTLLSLQEQHELLDMEIVDRIKQLNEAKTKSDSLDKDVQNHCLHTKKKMEIAAREQSELGKYSDSIKVLENRIKEEKIEQRTNLKNYEDKMSKIGHKLRSGPILYDKKFIHVEINSLKEEVTAISKELDSVEKQLNKLRSKYAMMLKLSGDGDDIDDTSKINLHTVIHQMNKEEILNDSEHEKLIEELQNLAEMSNNLQGDLQKFKQLENCLQ